jgi:hypothetical protein
MTKAKLLLLTGTLVGSVGMGVFARNVSSRSVAITNAAPALPGLCNIAFEDGAGNTIRGDIRELTPALAARMPFPTREVASAFVRSNQAPLSSAFYSLAPALSVRFQEFRRCLGYDKKPHPRTKIHIQWSLAASSRRLTASQFHLTRVEGHDREPLLGCFGQAFRWPVSLEGVPDPAARLTYEGGAPAFLVLDL